MASSQVVPLPLLNETHVVKSRQILKTVLVKFPYYSLFFLLLYIVVFVEIPLMSPTYQALLFDSDEGKIKEVYRWYTYSLLHIDVQHLLTNCFTWSIFASIVELENNKLRVFLMHTLGVLGGAFGCGWQIRFTGANIKLVGASGGIYGLWSCQVGNLIINWPELNLFKRVMYTTLLVMMTLTDVIVNSVMYNPHVSYSTHIGGFFMGIFAGGALMHNVRKLKWERHFRAACQIVVVLLTLAGSFNLLLP